MDIAQLRDTQPVKSVRKVGNGDFQLAHGEVKSSLNKTVGSAHKWYSASNHSRGLEEISAGMIDALLGSAAHCGSWTRSGTSGFIRRGTTPKSPHPICACDEFNEQVGNN